jgi:menaquinol-cytochrome c reductase iron-sulfur subunit
MASSHHISRRDFIKITTAVLGTIMGAVIGLPVIDYLIDPALKAQRTDAWIPLGKLESYTIGKPALFTFTRSTTNGWEKTVNSYGVFVVRKSDTEVVVLSNKCTHLSCRVNWKEDQQEYICPCHNAQFGMDGNILGGPPPRPLDRYEPKVEDGNLSIHFLEG